MKMRRKFGGSVRWFPAVALDDGLFSFEKIELFDQNWTNFEYFSKISNKQGGTLIPHAEHSCHFRKLFNIIFAYLYQLFHLSRHGQLYMQ